VQSAAGRFQSRPTALGRRAAASTPHQLATSAALDVMARGGNAVDAAVAAAAVCTVVQPFTSSLAGVGWAMVYAPGAPPQVLEFTGAAPAHLRVEELHADASGLVDRGRLEAEGKDLLVTLAPALITGWEQLIARRGRWRLGAVLESAIAYAAEGFPASELLAQTVERNATRLQKWPSSAAFLPDGRPLRAGEILRQPELAATLQRVATGGADELRTGGTAAAIADFFARHGGALDAADLAAMRANWLPPLSTTFRGQTVYAAAAPLGDVAFVSGLQILDRFAPFADPLDPEYAHVSIESAKLVARDRAQHLGFDTPPGLVDQLLSSAHTDELVGAIGPRASAAGVDNADGHTITLAVVDSAGMAVNLMQTVGVQFGTGAVIEGTGMFANNSATFCYPRARGRNRLVAGQKVEQNPCLAMVFRPSGELTHVVGSPGGKARVETVRQMLVNLLDHGLSPQQAVDAPRFLRSPDGTEVIFERRYGPDIDPGLRDELEARGHVVRVVDELFASGQLVGIDPLSGARYAAADWRRESVALAD
jgi:gamma-glutamyltranspeptidase / glutathione hydrolase